MRRPRSPATRGSRAPTPPAGEYTPIRFPDERNPGCIAGRVVVTGKTMNDGGFAHIAGGGYLGPKHNLLILRNLSKGLENAAPPMDETEFAARLSLDEKLAALDRHQEAYENYQRLLQEFPNYPDQLTLYRKLLPLAQKLDKKVDAQGYEAEINRLAPPPPKPAPKS